MKKIKSKNTNPRHLKQKLMSAMSMLLVATILMTSTTYAWFVLSTAPEVTGIETQVGANGSLEITLLNTETRTDMSLIRSGLGGSLADDDADNRLAANNAWGNLVDLSVKDYGLGNLLLMPARLDVSATANGYAVSSGMLSVPTYGYDGRIIELTNNTQSGIYQNSDFMYKAGSQDYGVRAIGTSGAMTPQSSALAQAKGNITSYAKTARSTASATLTKNGAALFNIVINHVSGSDQYNDENKATLDSMLADLTTASNYIDSALRQGLVGIAASKLGNEKEFATARDLIMDTRTSVATLLNNLKGISGIPSAYTTWARELQNLQNDLIMAQNASGALEDGSYTWDEIKAVMNTIMNVDNILIAGKRVNELSASELTGMLGSVIKMTLAPGSGAFAVIADFADDYSVNVNVGMATIEMATASVNYYLDDLRNNISGLTAASGGADASALPLTATYGYALDLAFRCNATAPDLVLQTKGVQRVYNGGENPDDITSNANATQGGGSYMEFTYADTDLSVDQRLALMEAIRVGFVDDLGNILGIAKLNITSREVENGVIRAPLYLYNYKLTKDPHGMVLEMGERRLTDNKITDLEQNVAKAVTVLVWLDGDIVDNTMVSATNASSLDGTLNLQFATSAELVPAVDGKVKAYNYDKSGLEVLIAEKQATFDEGQVNYTTVSWTAFRDAFNRAVAVAQNDNASMLEIRNAVSSLEDAADQLKIADMEALETLIADVRKIMGSLNEVGAYAIEDEEGKYIAVTSYTQEQIKNGLSINRVNDAMNCITDQDMDDQHQKVDYEFDPVLYSEESWNELARVLYQAEAIKLMGDSATEAYVDEAITALAKAWNDLDRLVYFLPYEYKGEMYYAAICEIGKEDIYGKWYDGNYQRIYDEMTILNLNAYSSSAEIVEMGQKTYIQNDVKYITPTLAFLTQVFPELRGVQVKGAQWKDIDTKYFTEMMVDYHYNSLDKLVKMLETDAVLKYETSEKATNAKTLAQDLINKYINNEEVTAEEAQECINVLNNAIVELYAANLEKMEQANTKMTENQRTLLNAAITSAKAVKGYDNEKQEKMVALKEATEAAENLLKGSEITKEEANEKLTALNEKLTAVGANMITEENTIIHTLPEFSEAGVIYDVYYPGLSLKLTGEQGITTLRATVLTEDGVLINVAKEVKIFKQADTVVIMHGKDEVESLTLHYDEDLETQKTETLNAVLKYLVPEDVAVEDVVVVEDVIKTVKWASKNTKVATVEATTGVVTPVAAGATTLTLSVTTEGEHTYTAEIEIIVE